MLSTIPILSLLLVSAVITGSSAASSKSYLPPRKADLSSCRVIYFEQPLDHFTFSVNTRTYKQRVFICDPANLEQKVQQGLFPAEKTNIFFYTGNEADVELYVNNTGLMWENAASFNALLVFAEHRYFGKSLPFPGEPMPKGNDKLQYLTADQALADYATLIQALKTSDADLMKLKKTPISVAITDKAAVTGFGGSYGGMLCSWMRLKYPSALNAGCIAGSAPIIDFEKMTPPLDFNYFSNIVTDDCGVKGGLPTNNCQKNIHTVMALLSDKSNSPAEYARITEGLELCQPITSYSDAMTAANSFIGSIGTMSMGSFPYPSDYMTNGKGSLPPYPMRFACTNTGLSRDPKEFIGNQRELLNSFASGMRVFYDAGQNHQRCINVQQDVNVATEIVNYLWGYLSCTTLVMPQSSNGDLSHGGDMFISAPWKMSDIIKGCRDTYEAIPNPGWVQASFGGRGVPLEASKIFFSNGELDPWRGGGIVPNAPKQPSIQVEIVRGGGHHMDLMFSHPQDKLTNVREVREAELMAINNWINEARN